MCNTQSTAVCSVCCVFARGVEEEVLHNAQKQAASQRRNGCARAGRCSK